MAGKFQEKRSGAWETKQVLIRVVGEYEDMQHLPDRVQGEPGLTDVQEDLSSCKSEVSLEPRTKAIMPDSRITRKSRQRFSNIYEDLKLNISFHH